MEIYGNLPAKIVEYVAQGGKWLPARGWKSFYATEFSAATFRSGFAPNGLATGRCCSSPPDDDGYRA